MTPLFARLFARRLPQVLAPLAVAAFLAAPFALPLPGRAQAVRAQEEAPVQAAAEAKADAIELDAKVPSLLMLDPTSKVWSLQVTSGSRLDVQVGDTVVNSSNEGALWNADGVIESAGAIRVVGGTTFLGKPSTRPAPLTQAASEDDPLPQFWVQPGPVQSNQKLFLNNEPEVTMPPGIYNGGIFATGADSVITMQPGTYIINGGDFFVSGARLQGEGVTIVMSGAQPGSFWCASGAQLDLSAPTDGPLQNIVLLSRAKGWNKLQLDGTQVKMQGLVYIPEAGAALSAASDVTLDRLICANLGLALKSKLHITGKSLTLQSPQTPQTDAIPDTQE